MEGPSEMAAPAASGESPVKKREFLVHLEAYLAKRDGVDKVLKISRYASKIILSSSILPPSHPLTHRLKSFESSVGLSRKAFRLGKFIQDVNSLRSTSPHDHPRFLLSLLSYGGEGVYYFIEQIVWLSKSGLIHPNHARRLQKLSAWAEFLGYIGSITLKLQDLIILNHRISTLSEEQVLKQKILMKKMSILQDLADALMALSDIRDTKDILSSPLLLSSAGLLSALISTHKNWLSS